MADIVEKLRELSTPERRKYGVPADVAMDEAADLITALRAKNGKLRAALELFACDCTAKHLCAQPDNCVNYIARTELEEK